MLFNPCCVASAVLPVPSRLTHGLFIALKHALAFQEQHHLERGSQSRFLLLVSQFLTSICLGSLSW